MFEADKNVLVKMMRIDCEYDGRPVKVDCTKILTFRSELDEEREKCVKWYQRVGSLLAEATKRRDFLKAELDSLKGELDEHARKYEVLHKPTDEKVKGELDEHARKYEVLHKPTDEKVKNWVNRNPDYVTKRKMLAEQEAKVGKLNTLHWALVKKMDMLVERGADRRNEVMYGAGIGKLPPEHKRNNRTQEKRKVTGENDGSRS
jgi:hypothetical protein